MGMSSLKLLKYVLFFFNLLFWICGCCILGFGIYLLIHNNFGVLFHNLPSLTLGNVFVIVGSIIMVVAFLGCMGSIKENKCLLMSLNEYVAKGLTDSIHRYHSDNSTKAAWDSIQSFGCYAKARLWFHSNFLYIGIITICVCVIEVLGMSFALTLNCQIDKTSQSIGL
ncbi:leukocyte surface antigen CD53 isoform X4 [Macaca fascicularis]|uniref:leukocyte surface antigen CD53 isoform X4 n=1 Tax=Macaca fascicularis TaxID=9541 RepID=UPI003D15453A